MTDVVTQQSSEVELPKRPRGGERDPSVSRAGEIARVLMSDLAVGKSVEKPRFSTNNPEDLLTPAARVYFDELKEAFHAIALDLDAGKIDISVTFHGQKLGHYLDDIGNFIDDPEDVAYIREATNQVLGLVEERQSRINSQQSRAIAKDYFDLMQVNGTTPEMRRRTVPGIDEAEPRLFFDKMNMKPDAELNRAIEAIWGTYRSMAFQNWQKMVVSQDFKDDLGIDELADSNRTIVERYVNTILSSRQIVPRKSSRPIELPKLNHE